MSEKKGAPYNPPDVVQAWNDVIAAAEERGRLTAAVVCKCGDELQPNDGAICGACLQPEIAEAEERGRRSGVEERDELRAALKAAEKDRDTWKRLCEKADAQATTATIRANKLADKRGYDIDDDAEERGRRRGVEEERRRAMTVVHILHQCIRGKCACTDNGAISQFACEDTARKAIDAWTDLAPRDSAPAAAPQAIPGTHAARREREKARDSGKEGQR